MGAPSLPVDPVGLAPGRRLQQISGEQAVAPLPDVEVRALKDELRRVQAFVGMPAAASALVPSAAAAVVAVTPAAAEESKWADAGRGPQPLKDAVATVAGDVDALRKHMKAVSDSWRRGSVAGKELWSHQPLGCLGTSRVLLRRPLLKFPLICNNWVIFRHVCLDL